MHTKTYREVLAAHAVEIPAHLLADAEVPVATGLQIQGDVAVVPTRPAVEVGELVPAEGVAVVRGEAGGNTHLLVGTDIRWRPVIGGGLEYGVVTVPDGGEAFLLHPEHGATGIGGGCYVLSGQREQADEIRRVAD